jgi:outer membrane protein insertion porin family
MVTATPALSLFIVRLPVLVVALATCVGIAPGQTSGVDLDGRTITRIVFDPPDQPLPLASLEKILPLHAGEKLVIETLHTAIQKLYETGRYSDVSIDGKADGGGVLLTIATRETYFISGVSVDGVPEPPTRGQLESATKLELGAPFHDGDLAQAGENIEERLRANGLYQAKVTSHVDRYPATEEIFIHYHVEPGDRARFDGVTLTGEFKQPAQNIINDTHWRRGLWLIHVPGWRQETENLVQRGVSRVLNNFQKGDHLQASVALESLQYHDEENTVTPTLALESGPILEVRTEGLKISKGKLRQIIPIYEERTVDRSLLVEGRRDLIEYLQSQGYFEAEVNFTESTPEPGRQVIDYSITPNLRHKLVYIGVSGNDFFDAPTIRERLSMTPARWFSPRFGLFSQKMLENDLDAIRYLYRSNGFRDVEVAGKTEDDYQGVHGHLSVHIEIREGPQWFVDKLDLQGFPEGDLPYIRSVLQSTAGEPYSESNIAADRDTILSYYYNNGYPNAAFDWSESPGSADYRVNIAYTVQPGKREYVRAVLVRGLKTTRESLVEKRLKLKPGDPLSQSQIAQAQQKLYDLGIFSKVQTAVQNPEGDEDDKYVLYDIDEANRYSFNAGIGAQLGRIGGGVTTFDEPAGSTGFSPRVSLGISRLNLFGEGRTLSLQTRISTIEQRALLSYTAPQLFDDEALTLTISGLFDNSRDIRTFAAQRAESSIQLAQRLTRANSFQYRFTFRHVIISDLVISPELVPLFSQPEREGILSMTFIQDRRDDPINTHRGVYNTIDMGVALKGLGSISEFSRVLMRNSTYHPLGHGLVLARTLQFGWVQRLAGPPDIPLAERFFSGGATSDRAFPDNQAGPRDLETGFPLGGDALLMHSTELRFPLIGTNLGGVIFHDVGNVFADLRDIDFRFHQNNIQDFDYMVQGIGFGLRYKTPVGPIRVDFSFSPNSPRFYGFQGTFDQLLANQGVLTNQRISWFQFHFSLGQTF